MINSYNKYTLYLLIFVVALILGISIIDVTFKDPITFAEKKCEHNCNKQQCGYYYFHSAYSKTDLCECTNCPSNASYELITSFTEFGGATYENCTINASKIYQVDKHKNILDDNNKLICKPMEISK